MKPKHKKIYILRQLMRIRGMNSTQVGEQIEVSHPTANKYIRKPETMDGELRKKMAAALKIDISKLDDVCNGVITNVEQLIGA